MDESRKAIIIGAGPAGLTAGYELLERTPITPVILEKTADIGGISKTVNYKGNRIDIGGHRFFSKSDQVMQWWRKFLPLQGTPSIDDRILGRRIRLSSDPDAPDPDQTDNVMLIRNRLSRIFFMRKFFDYPVSLNLQTVLNLGITRMGRIGFSYMKSSFFPIAAERSLEDFFINRFGRELYLTFFKDYTEKVWGISCDRIRPEWGAQRIKGLSISKAVYHAVKSLVSRPSTLEQKNVETSLIEQFMYPKHGPGQLWEEVALRIEARGGTIERNRTVIGIEHEGGRITSVLASNGREGRPDRFQADAYFSTMPVRDLIRAMGEDVPAPVREVAQGLSYRNFITVGLLLKGLKIKNGTAYRTINNIIPDNWIYVQERDVRLGRIQVFNNWSPYLVNDPDTVWLGLEYFCSGDDGIWTGSDEAMARLAVEELVRIGMIDESQVLDHVTIRMPDTYPGYFGTYDRFGEVRDYLDRFENLYLIGRNGMHRYNNQDHSMLTAMTAVDNIRNGIRSRDSIWDVNAEEDYHEER